MRDRPISPGFLSSRMKDKKDGKSRTPYGTGCGIGLNNSPLASSTTEKDDLNSPLAFRSYHHHHHPQHHGYYQTPPSSTAPIPPFSSPSPASYSKPFQQPIDYGTNTQNDMYEMTANYCMKQSQSSSFNPSTYYTNSIGNNLKNNYLPPNSYDRAPVSFDSYYFNSDNSTALHHQQQTGPVVPPFA